MSFGGRRWKLILNFRAGYRLNCLDLVRNRFFSLRALYGGIGGEAAATMVVVDSSILFGFR